jgi:hypothetical protein
VRYPTQPEKVTTAVRLAATYFTFYTCKECNRSVGVHKPDGPVVCGCGRRMKRETKGESHAER